MTNEQEKDTQNQEDLELEPEEESDDSEESQKSAKKEFTDEEKLARVDRMRTKLLKKLGRGEDKTEIKSEPKEKASSDLDYGEKAFLRSYDIKGADELALAKQWRNRTGDELDTMVEDDMFQSKLKSLREAKAAADAVPKATKRATAPAKDDLQYWLEKPFADVPSNLKAGVLALRVEQERTQGQFSSNPVVFGGNQL